MAGSSPSIALIKILPLAACSRPIVELEYSVLENLIPMEIATFTPGDATNAKD